LQPSQCYPHHPSRASSCLYLKLAFPGEKTFLGRARDGREKCVILKPPLKSVTYIVFRLKPEISPCAKRVPEEERCREATDNGKSCLSHLQYQRSGPNPHCCKHCTARHRPCPAGLAGCLEHLLSSKSSNRGE